MEFAIEVMNSRLAPEVVVNWCERKMTVKTCASASLPTTPERRSSLGKSSLAKSSFRQQTVANASGAMRIRNIGMLLNPSPCQFAATAQHHGVIRRAHDLFAALVCFLGGSEIKAGLVDDNVRRPNEGNPSRRRCSSQIVDRRDRQISRPFVAPGCAKPA